MQMQGGKSEGVALWGQCGADMKLTFQKLFALE